MSEGKAFIVVGEKFQNTKTFLRLLHIFPEPLLLGTKQICYFDGEFYFVYMTTHISKEIINTSRKYTKVFEKT